MPHRYTFLINGFPDTVELTREEYKEFKERFGKPIDKEGLLITLMKPGIIVDDLILKICTVFVVLCLTFPLAITKPKRSRSSRKIETAWELDEEEEFSVRMEQKPVRGGLIIRRDSIYSVYQLAH